MKIYVTHASTFDYQTELYKPLRNSNLHIEHQVILPHENSTGLFSTKEFISQQELIIAEVSYPSTGQGIELGWANIHNVPIVCIYKSGTHPSSGLKMITEYFIEYDSPTDMIQKLSDFHLLKT
jgi:hypothetical protein